jgi:YfiH family protein
VTVVFLGEALAAFADGSMTVGRDTAEEIAGSAASWVSARLGREVPLLFARQEHTRLTFVYGEERPLGPGPHLVGICDALITEVSGVALQVRTADCLPIALAGGGVVAMVHAGWRGLAADILATTLARFAGEHGVAAADVEAVIGIGVGPCHYQVGNEVLEALRRREAGATPWLTGSAVDLAAFARGRLAVLGVPPSRIVVLPGCTACLPSFHSHRRDGAGSGRQWSLIVKAGDGL